MTTFQGLTATQWRNRINEYNPGMYTKEFLKNKTAKELAEIQNGKSYGLVSESKSAAGSKPMSAIRAKLEAIKKQKISAIQKEKSASSSVQQLLATLSKPDKAPVRKPKAPARKNKAKESPDSLSMSALVKAYKEAQKLFAALEANNPKTKAKVQEWDPDSDDEDEESDESEEE